MKKIIIIIITILLMQSPGLHAQDTASTNSKVTADANTSYLDESGIKIGVDKFLALVNSGIYTYVPTIADGKLVSLKLQQKKSKVVVGSPVALPLITDIKGKTYSPTDLKGKIVVLDFWFIACEACIAEMPDLNVLADKYKDDPDIIFLAVTFDDLTGINKFLLETPFHFNIIPGRMDLIQQYGISAFPETWVIGRKGTLVYKITGNIGEQTALKKAIRSGLQN